VQGQQIKKIKQHKKKGRKQGKKTSKFFLSQKQTTKALQQLVNLGIFVCF